MHPSIHPVLQECHMDLRIIHERSIKGISQPRTTERMRQPCTSTHTHACAPAPNSDALLPLGPGMALSSHWAQAWPSPPAGPRHGPLLPLGPGMALSSRWAQAWPSPPAGPRHGPLLPLGPGMALSSRWAQAWPSPPLGPGMALFSCWAQAWPSLPWQGRMAHVRSSQASLPSPLPASPIILDICTRPFYTAALTVVLHNLTTSSMDDCTSALTISLHNRATS
eukprot:365482-Chlamydomonas_euryale.AAC.19